MTGVVWMHRDLRVRDNPALVHALSRHEQVVVVFSWSRDVYGDWMPGGAQQVWIDAHLRDVARSLARIGVRFIVTEDAPGAAVRAAGADAVYWNEPLTPAAREAGRVLAADCRSLGVGSRVFAGDLLHDPDAVRTQKGDPYRVFTPFYRSFLDQVAISVPVAAPDRAVVPDAEAERLEAQAVNAIDGLGLVPDLPWAARVLGHWGVGEDAAHERLAMFLDGAVARYADGRNRPDTDGSSRLSPYLAIGVLSPRQVWDETVRRCGHDGDAAVFLREIGWREFGYHLLFHFPETTAAPLNPSWTGFPWRDDPAGLRAWQRGETGYPIVDAGMHQLWETGWMHNRVRMIVASFLTKDLLVSWQEGAAWFWDTLIDADLANNTLGWQWAAGSGADAQPFFRIFNPDSQQKKHDPDGRYVRQWDGGRSMPVVDHAEARARALALYESFKAG